jgi:hypothetical protein
MGCGLERLEHLLHQPGDELDDPGDARAGAQRDESPFTERMVVSLVPAGAGPARWPAGPRAEAGRPARGLIPQGSLADRSPAALRGHTGTRPNALTATQASQLTGLAVS